MSPRSQEVKQAGLFGFLAQPDAPTTAGVVILPTIYGVNPFVRGYAELLAGAGLAAAVWDHYEGLPLSSDYEDSKRRSQSITDAAMHAKVAAWIGYLTGELQLTAVGVLGFCLGGRFAPMVAARDRRIRACAAAYPSIYSPGLPHQLEDTVALAAEIACPVLVIQPGHDHVATPETYAALRQALAGRSAPTIWHFYPEAEHGFMHRKESAANAAATAIASPQLVGFLRGCLSG
jgi:carboxymethylenebutenolidase